MRGRRSKDREKTEKEQAKRDKDHMTGGVKSICKVKKGQLDIAVW